MKGWAMLARSPLEVGDTVVVKGWGEDQPATVTEIVTEHRASTGEVRILHYIDGWCMPLDALAYRIGPNGEHIAIGEQATASEEVRT